MAIEFIIPMIASMIQGGLAHGMAANQAANQRNEQIRMARMRREELQPIIDKLRQARDYFDVEEQFVRDFSRADNQMSAQAQQSGMSNAGAGGLDANRASVLGEMLSGLAQFKQQDDLQRTAMLAEILADPSLQVGNLQEGDVAGQSILAGLLGVGTGAATQLNAYLSTPEGIDILKGLGQKKPDLADMGLGDVFGAGRTDQAAIGQPRPRQLSLSPSANILPGNPGGGLPTYYRPSPAQALW